MLDNGKVVSVMDLVNKPGPMVQSTWVNGETTAHTEKENSSTSMEISTTDFGLMTKLTDLVSTSTLMERNMKVSGRMIYSTVKV